MTTLLGSPRALRPGPERCELSLTVPARATSLTVVRHAVGGVASAIGLSPHAVADIRLAVTEACSAAIRRADGDRSLVVRAELADGELRVSVQDASASALAPGQGLPLALVAAITDSVELTRRDQGTEVAMTFAAPDAERRDA